MLVAAVLALAAAESVSPGGYTATERRHWSFQPRTQPTIPHFDSALDRAWASNPIDAFVLAALKKGELAAAPRADSVTLIRRVTFDLTGLPPTPAEIDQFVTD